jgi:hypothetical protein
MKRRTSVIVTGVLSVALSAFTSSSCKDITGSACSQYKIECGKIQNGIEVVGGVVPDKCNCPSNTTFAGQDNVTAGGPYNQCLCK